MAVKDAEGCILKQAQWARPPASRERGFGRTPMFAEASALRWMRMSIHSIKTRSTRESHSSLTDVLRRILDGDRLAGLKKYYNGFSRGVLIIPAAAYGGQKWRIPAKVELTVTY